MQEDGSLSLDERLAAWEERMRSAQEKTPPAPPGAVTRAAVERQFQAMPPQQQIRLRPEDLARLAASRRGGPRG